MPEDDLKSVTHALRQIFLQEEMEIEFIQLQISLTKQQAEKLDPSFRQRILENQNWLTVKDKNDLITVSIIPWS